ncbi:hypothetical protein ND748_28480, partial [Frankia sp. AiPs1]|uniref:hypothetical protein n=1 Tax=Frankia sp. AiPs1 TaxID=573493 RepID=UPI002042F6DA
MPLRSASRSGNASDPGLASAGVRQVTPTVRLGIGRADLGRLCAEGVSAEGVSASAEGVDRWCRVGDGGNRRGTGGGGR